jgi:ATP-dependent Zn protease
MRIEKNTKNSLENLHSLSRENRTLIFRINQWISTHRLNSRSKLLANPINLTTVITFFPLVLGFSQFLLNKSMLSKTMGNHQSFFEKNFPVFTQFKPRLNFETFEYISKSNTRTLPKKSATDLIFGQPTFIKTLKKPDYLNTSKVRGLTCNFYVIPSGNCFSKTSSIIQRVRHLDDLPAYMQGLRQLKEKGDKINSTSFLVLNQANLKIKPLSRNNVKEKNQPRTFLGTPNFKKKLSLVNSFEYTDLKKSFSADFIKKYSPFYRDRVDFYNTEEQLHTELQALFTKKNISLSSRIELFDNKSKKNLIQNESRTLKNFLTQHIGFQDEFLIETLLQELNKSIISKNYLNFRLMSGYKYPDMISEDLYWFFAKGRYKGKSVPSLISEISPLSSKSRDYNFSVKNMPTSSISITQVSVENATKKVYKGSAVVLDSQRSFDWKLRNEEKQNLRHWFHTYLSPLNPLKQSLENFFGIYHSPKFLQEGQKAEFSYFAKNSLFYETWMTNGASSGPIQTTAGSLFSFSPYSSSFHIPYEQKKIKNKFLKNIEVEIADTKDTNQFITIPILQIRHPFSNNSTTGSINNQFQYYSPHFNFISKGCPDYVFSTDCGSPNNFLTKNVSGRYLKTASLFSKTRISNPINLDHWEPLTSSSWLLITQLSFAIFIFQVLKSLAENYGRELLGYLLDLVASLGILDDSLKQEIQILMGQREKGFRVVLESRKNFKDIVGIQKLLPEIYEVVWFLRNSARDFALSKTLPRGILLTGPPGTGKTLLVQALAGEAQVPVIVLSGSSLIEPGESGALKLEMVFQEARQLAPCIVFIDEIDTLAQKRSGVVQNPMGPDELVESLTSFEKKVSGSKFEELKLARNNQDSENDLEKTSPSGSQQDQLSLLTQFLIELDGIQGRDGVIVIGATNRPEVLDPALLRPGRFDKVIEVGLPGHQKRIEILQFYGQSLGYQIEIPWGYLGDRTAGFTAADLATLMNESTIKAILTQTKHTIETIEHGIDRLTTSESEKYTVFKTHLPDSLSKFSSLTISSKMSVLRLAYYQAGKIVLSSLLDNHPKSVVASLWPRRPTIRSAQIATNLQNSVFEFARLSEITDRLVGCYAGKAAEVLFVQQFSSSKYAQLSTLGLEDLFFAQKLVNCILEKWLFYSKKTTIQQITQLSPNINVREFREIPEKLDLYNAVVETIQIPPMRQALESQTSSVGSKKNTGVSSSNAQLFYSIPWWQQEISSELEFVEKNFTNWSRLYLSNPEQNERNPEWLPPDEFYHNSSGLKNVKKAFANLSKTKNQNLSLRTEESILSNEKQRYLPKKAEFSWNEVALLTRDYPSQSLVLQSFNKALLILNNNRELLDRLVIELLYHEILRQPEIDVLLEDFDSKILKSQEDTFLDLFEQKQKIKVIESSWGLRSRKSTPRWIDFAQVCEETT